MFQWANFICPRSAYSEVRIGQMTGVAWSSIPVTILQPRDNPTPLWQPMSKFICLFLCLRLSFIRQFFLAVHLNSST